MISFKQYLFESAPGNYVSIGVETPLIIKSLEPLYGGSVVTSPEDQHVTLIYSRGTDVDKSKINGVLHHYDHEIECSVIGVEAFDSPPKDGQRDENLCAIVVRIKSVELEEIHDRLKKIGLNHSYPDYSAHISVMYKLPRERKDDAIQTVSEWLKKNMSTVMLRGYKVEPINETWTDKKKLEESPMYEPAFTLNAMRNGLNNERVGVKNRHPTATHLFGEIYSQKEPGGLLYYKWKNGNVHELSCIIKDTQKIVDKGDGGSQDTIMLIMAYHVAKNGKLYSDKTNTKGSENLWKTFIEKHKEFDFYIYNNQTNSKQKINSVSDISGANTLWGTDRKYTHIQILAVNGRIQK